MTDSRTSKSREGFKQLGHHHKGCFALRDGAPFVVTDRPPFDFHRKMNGDRGGGTMWWRFVCNDINCEAKLLVRWDKMAAFVNGTDV